MSEMVSRSMSPKTWTTLLELGIDVMHLGPGDLGAVVVNGQVILSGGCWYVRPTQQQ